MPRRGQAVREVSVAGYCIQAATDALDAAGSAGDEHASGTAHVMTAITMLAFALEADVNHLLARVVESNGELRPVTPSLEEAYWLPIRQRIELYYRWIGAELPDLGARPFQVVGALKTFRDAIAHGKPFVTQSVALDIVEGEAIGTPPLVPKKLMATWERDCTLERAQRYYDDLLAADQSMRDASGMQLGQPLAFIAVVNVSYDAPRGLA